MPTRKIVSFIIRCATIFVWFTACFDQTSPDYFDEDRDTLVLQYGESAIARFGGICVTFSDVLEDSRCPSNVYCKWEGVARIHITLKEKCHQMTDVVLPIYGYVFIDDSARQVAVDTLGYTLMLMQLDPYPIFPNEPDYNTYQATILIEHNKER